MSKRRQLPDPDRRKFLQGATLAGAAAVTPVTAAGQGIAPAAVPPAGVKAGVPGRIQVARETSPPDRDPVTQTSSGGDFMVDVLKTLDIDYLAMNCASSFRGLHEAVINYARQHKPGDPHLPARGNRGRHGARLRQDRGQADGDDLPRRRRPAARHHGDVQRLVRPRAGVVMGGNIMEADKRGPGAEWVHSAVDIGRDRARLHQVGRPAGLAAAFRRVGGARLQDRHHAADGAGAASRSTRNCRKTRSRSARSCTFRNSSQSDPAAGRCRRASRKLRKAAGRGASTRSSWSIAWRARRPAWRGSSSSPKRCNAR